MSSVPIITNTTLVILLTSFIDSLAMILTNPISILLLFCHNDYKTKTIEMRSVTVMIENLHLELLTQSYYILSLLF